MLYINNGTIKIGIVLEEGGRLAHFSNLIDNVNVFPYVEGTLVEIGTIMSVYGDPLGATDGKGWNLNQQLSQFGELPSIVTGPIITENEIYVKALPVIFEYYDGNMDVNLELEQWLTLNGNVVTMRHKLTYTGPDRSQNYATMGEVAEPPWYGSPGVWAQEAPFVAMSPSLNHYALYSGGAPWTGQAVEQGVLDTFTGTTPTTPPWYNPTEKWMAGLNSSGWGLGIYAPDCAGFLAGDRAPYSVAIEPSQPFGFTAGWPTPVVMEYTVHFTIGTVEEIRSRFYTVSAYSFSVQPSATDGLISYQTECASDYTLAYSTDNGTNFTTVGTESPGSHTLDLSALPSGTYQVKLRITPLSGDTTPVVSEAVEAVIGIGVIAGTGNLSGVAISATTEAATGIGVALGLGSLTEISTIATTAPIEGVGQTLIEGVGAASGVTVATSTENIVGTGITAGTINQIRGPDNQILDLRDVNNQPITMQYL